MDLSETELQGEGCYVAVTNDYLNVQAIMDRVRDPGAGAIVIFAGEAIRGLPSAIPFL